jgi:tetratricopeptide (TPR) repeat protein
MDPDGPSSPTLFARRASCYAALGDSQKALDVVDEGVRLYPEFALLQVSRARILDGLGRVPEATTAWLAAHDLNPFDPEVQDALVKDLTATGETTWRRATSDTPSLLKSGGIVDVGGPPATPLPKSGPG